MKDIAEMNYSEFTQFLDGEGYDRIENIMHDEEFDVYIDKQTGRYFYLEGGINDADEFCELILLARLTYDVNFDIGDSELKLFSAFHADISTERVLDGHIEFMWFNKNIKKPKREAHGFETFQAVKLSLHKAVELISAKVSDILGHNVPCRIAIDSYDYWGISLKPYCMEAPEILKILSVLSVDGEMAKKELPNDEDGATCIHDFGMEVSELLLKKAIPFYCREYFFDEENVWLIVDKENSYAEDKTDNLS